MADLGLKLEPLVPNSKLVGGTQRSARGGEWVASWEMGPEGRDGGHTPDFELLRVVLSHMVLTSF